MQVTLPSYLRADFEEFFGGTTTGSPAPAAAQPGHPQPGAAAAAVTPAAGQASTAEAGGLRPAASAAPATQPDACVASGTLQQQAKDAPFDKPPDPMQRTPQRSGHDFGAPSNQLSQPEAVPDSPPDSPPACVALDFMDAEQSPAAEGSREAADQMHQQQPVSVHHISSSNVRSTGCVQPMTEQGQRELAAAAEAAQVITTARPAEDAAEASVDMVFEDAAADAGEPSFRSAAGVAAARRAGAQSATAAKHGVSMHSADAAGKETRTVTPLEPEAAPAAAAGVVYPAEPQVSAPVVPVFRSRIGRMRLPAPVPPEDDAEEYSGLDLPSGDLHALHASCRSCRCCEKHLLATCTSVALTIYHSVLQRMPLWTRTMLSCHLLSSSKLCMQWWCDLAIADPCSPQMLPIQAASAHSLCYAQVRLRTLCSLPRLRSCAGAVVQLSDLLLTLKLVQAVVCISAAMQHCTAMCQRFACRRARVATVLVSNDDEVMGADVGSSPVPQPGIFRQQYWMMACINVNNTAADFDLFILHVYAAQSRFAEL